MINRVCPLCSGCSGVCSPATPGKASVQQDVYKMHWPAHGHPTQPLNAAVVHYTKNQEGTEMRTDIDHWLAIFPLGCCPPKNLLPKGKMPKRNPPPLGGGVPFWVFLGVLVLACPLGSWGVPSTPPDVAKGWHVWHLAILFYFPFMVRMFTLGNAAKKKSSCHVSSGIRRCCPLNSWRKQRQNQSIHTYLIIWVWIIPYHSCTKLMMPCRTWWLEKAGPIAQTHMLVLFAVEMLPL